MLLLVPRDPDENPGFRLTFCVDIHIWGGVRGEEGVAEGQLRATVLSEACTPSEPVHVFLVLFFFLRFNFIYFWLCWVFAAACGLSLAVASRRPLFTAVVASPVGRAPALGVCASVIVAHGL